ncbi:hypothetical protein RUM43_009173 [Polyplax serrata]|uniref:Uncharacterized protein n=1 Tax=Polyplax serrata TaxID=468196 RepID=A0AAN8NPV5_POLSC
MKALPLVPQIPGREREIRDASHFGAGQTLAKNRSGNQLLSDISFALILDFDGFLVTTKSRVRAFLAPNGKSGSISMSRVLPVKSATCRRDRDLHFFRFPGGTKLTERVHLPIISLNVQVFLHHHAFCRFATLAESIYFCFTRQYGGVYVCISVCEPKKKKIQKNRGVRGVCVCVSVGTGGHDTAQHIDSSTSREGWMVERTDGWSKKKRNGKWKSMGKTTLHTSDRGKIDLCALRITTGLKTQSVDWKRKSMRAVGPSDVSEG